jgi:hypothetical protein
MSTGDFTIEFWLNFSSLSNYQTIFTKGYNNAGGLLVQTNTGTGTLLVYVAGSVVITASSASTLGTWNHYALVRNSGTLTLYLNGTSVGSVSNSTNFNNTESFNVGGSVSGYYTNGYISNFRVVKGTAVYTTTFTPSTTPLTAITNTQLLVCQSNRYVDNSANAFSSTITGTPTVQRFNPFGTSTAYSTSVIGGSGYFDGSGDYLSLANNTAVEFGTGDYTVEFWAYRTVSATQAIVMFKNNSFVVNINASGGMYVYDGNVNQGGSAPRNTWNHYAACRASGTLKMYVNGVQVFSTASSADWVNDSTLTIGVTGSSSTADPFTGYLSNLRIVKGTAVYTSAFTPPTAPLTAISGTGLLLNTTNGAIFDNAMMNDLETVGNAQISTSVKKYGTGSLAFDGTGDCLKSNPATTDLYAFSSGAFTIEMWFYITAFTNTYNSLYDSRPVSTQGAYPTIAIQNNGKLYYYVSSAERIATATSAISTGQWYHLAVCRSGTSTKMFLDGTQVGSTYTDSTVYVNGTSRPVIGAEGFNSPPNDSINGYIDDLRITKGYARYTANFTPPTAAFSNIGPT